MRIAVVGAGIIGVSSAFELAQDGHAVTVFERRSGVAAEASFAPAGLAGVSGLAPWAAAGVAPGPLLGLFGASGSLARWPEPSSWAWRWRVRRAARASASGAPPSALHRLARYSQERMEQLRGAFQMEFERTRGVLLLLRTQGEAERAQAGLERLQELDTNAQMLERSACYRIEPGLNRDQPLAGGLHLPQDESGNCRQFVHLLRDGAERAGVEFRFGSIVRSLGAASAEGIELQTEQLALTTGFTASRVAPTPGTGTPTPLARRARAAARYLEPVSSEHFDAVVIAAGAASAAWLPALGLAVPLMPMQGYSVTAALRAPERGPQAAVVDSLRQTVISRLGLRVRVAGVSEWGTSTEPRQAAVEALYAALNDWFAGCAHLARPQIWKGARPMLPGGPPVIGASPRPGVWLNLGHGNRGWALACGSARLMADQIAGRPTAIDAAPFDARRFAKR